MGLVAMTRNIHARVRNIQGFSGLGIFRAWGWNIQC